MVRLGLLADNAQTNDELEATPVRIRMHFMGANRYGNPQGPMTRRHWCEAKKTLRGRYAELLISRPPPRTPAYALNNSQLSRLRHRP